MERELLVERAQSGIAAARARGRVGGRRRAHLGPAAGSAATLRHRPDDS